MAAKWWVGEWNMSFPCRRRQAHMPQSSRSALEKCSLPAVEKTSRHKLLTAVDSRFETVSKRESNGKSLRKTARSSQSSLVQRRTARSLTPTRALKKARAPDGVRDD